MQLQLIGVRLGTVAGCCTNDANTPLLIAGASHAAELVLLPIISAMAADDNDNPGSLNCIDSL